MLLFAAQYNKENIFSWFNKLYGNIWIHMDVLDEVLLKRQRVEAEIQAGRWRLFDPLTNFSSAERIIYNAQVEEIKEAFARLNSNRATSGKRVKNTANTGEISTLAVCLIEDAHLICSNDFDIRGVVYSENYTYIDDDDGEHLIVQDTAEDFCFLCVAETDITKAQVRRFYKTLFECPDIRNAKLASLDRRLGLL